jgi:uncharacterized protein (UPF0335 family)
MTNSKLQEIAGQILTLENQRDDLKQDIAAAYDAAKHYGYSASALRKAVRVLRLDSEKRAKHEAEQRDLLDYLAEIEGRQLREAAE